MQSVFNTNMKSIQTSKGKIKDDVRAVREEINKERKMMESFNKTYLIIVKTFLVFFGF